VRYEVRFATNIENTVTVAAALAALATFLTQPWRM